MKKTRPQTKLISTTAFGIEVTTCIEKQQTTAYHNGTLIYKKSLCGSKDLASAHLDNVQDFMKKFTTRDFRKSCI